MLTFFINAIKIIFLLGFLVFIHEGGHFIVAKLCKIKVNEFALGFGPTLIKKNKNETTYALRAIPLGGFVSLEGEESYSEAEGSFSKAGPLKKIAIVSAGGLVNIIFGIIAFFILILVLRCIITGDNFLVNIKETFIATGQLFTSLADSIKMLFTGNVTTNDLVGIVGISDVVVQTRGIDNYIYLIAMISISLGITNLLPFPPLDGGKIVIYIIEAIRRKPINETTEIVIQNIGFYILIALAIFVTYNDITRIF